MAVGGREGRRPPPPPILTDQEIMESVVNYDEAQSLLSDQISKTVAVSRFVSNAGLNYYFRPLVAAGQVYTCGDEHDELVAAETAVRKVDPEMADEIAKDHYELEHWIEERPYFPSGMASDTR